MEKVLVAALVGLLGVAPVAWADEGERDYIGEYYESIPRGNPVTIMMLEARACHNKAFYLMMGADLNERGFSYEEVERDAGFSEDVNSQIKGGFGFDDPFDPRIGQAFAKCLVDAHKSISSIGK